MSPDASAGTNLGWALWFLSEVAFKWVPGAVETAVGTGAPAPSDVSPALSMTLANPVTAPQVVQYLQTASPPGAYDALFQRWSGFVAFSLLISLALTTLILYCTIRMFQVRQLERRRFSHAQRSVAARDVPKTHLRWQRIIEQAASDSEQSRRVAILEADIMLNELLDVLGLKGETMADKMRNADRTTFQTLDRAWEAHRVRNRVVHQPDANLLSPREVRRVISLYESVFKEFRFIS